ncbi:hypothetical protein PsYK624_078790 [Phanerochaete sordida]|uniref:F-box domain-containing protein n=1 Tax=Phanerochaete sordida TaxID=48140 RepID=A0A9P3G993_9APHY|nr:hypothetical protein PsYK624_078790 [Phanerochaete sordida]
MVWDEVCVLCGIQHYAVPNRISKDPEEAAAAIANEVRDAGFIDLPLEDVKAMLHRVLTRGGIDNYVPLYGGAIDFDHQSDFIAIGHFDGIGIYKPCLHYDRPRNPTGDGVEIRRVTDQVMPVEFIRVLDLQRGTRVLSEARTNCSTYNSFSCNVAMHAPCWEYLQEWLGCTSNPRIGRNGDPLTLAGEMYEITASRREPQEECRGWLPCIDYGGTLDAYMGTNYQEYIVGPRRGSKHILQALKSGLREVQLIPALLRDARLWMWARPDRWPRAPGAGPYDPDPLSAASGAVPQPSVLICTLPNELFPEVLHHCRIEDVFAVGSTCKELYARVLNRSTLAHAVRKAMRNRASPLQWLVPVPALREEWLAACEAMQTWLGPTDSIDNDRTAAGDNDGGDGKHEGGPLDDEPPAGGDAHGDDPTVADDESLPSLPLFDPAFPIATFLRAYRTSASMQARRRRWELIKQWDALFASYRRDGWERDEFAPPGTTWFLDGDGRLKCQCQPEKTS